MNHAQRRAQNRRKEKSSKPFVRLNMAVSLDGHVIMEKGTWESTSKEDKRQMDSFRNWADCVVITRSTLEKDNPNLFIRYKPNSGRHPVPVIVQQNSKIPSPHLRLWKKPHPAPIFIVTSSEKTSEAKSPSREPIISNINNGIRFYKINSLAQVPDLLYSLDFRNILVEGGPTLSTALSRANLIDEYCLTLAPYLIGTGGRDRFVMGAQPLPQKKLKLIHNKRRKNELFLRYIPIKEKKTVKFTNNL